MNTIVPNLSYQFQLPLPTDHTCMFISQLGSAPKYLCIRIRPLVSLLPLCCLRSSQRHDLFMNCVRTTMDHTMSFASFGPSLWNHLPLLFTRLFSLLSFPRHSHPSPGTEMH